MGVVRSGSDYNSPERRSQRVTMKTPVVVLMRGNDNKTVSDETRTVTVNAHGAMIVTRLKLSVGQLVTLRNSRSEEETSCRVVYVSPHQAEKQEVGLEFIEPHPNFWFISFPPADWTKQSPEAKGNTRRYAPTASKKKN